jgi:hypothetical protein
MFSSLGHVASAPGCCILFSMSKKLRSTKARSPAEKFRDVFLKGYPEWPSWSRKLRRIFVSLPSYGVGNDALESMCEDFEWDLDSTLRLVNRNKSFKQAVNEYVENNYDYRLVERVTSSGETALDFQVRWSVLQQVYMLESGITSFIKAETGKVSIAENKLIERTGLLEIEPLVIVDNSRNSRSLPNVDIAGESSLYELESILNGK